MCDFSGLTIGSYKGFTWQVSLGKAALLMQDLVHSQCTAASEKSCRQTLRLSSWLSSLSVCVPSQVPAVLGLSI